MTDSSRGKADLAMAEEDPNFKHKLHQQDPTFALFKHSAKNQRSAVNKLRELLPDNILTARNKKNEEKRLAEESTLVHAGAIE